MSILRTTTDISCGVNQIYEVANSVKFDWIELLIETDPGETLIFSDNNEGEGRRLATWMARKKLGTVVSRGWKTNPGSGNKINVWIFTRNNMPVSRADCMEVPSNESLDFYGGYEGYVRHYKFLVKALKEGSQG